MGRLIAVLSMELLTGGRWQGVCDVSHFQVWGFGVFGVVNFNMGCLKVILSLILYYCRRVLVSIRGVKDSIFVDIKII